MPLGALEREVLRLLAVNRNPDSYVAGATVLNQNPASPRTSKDVDVFHDSAKWAACISTAPASPSAPIPPHRSSRNSPATSAASKITLFGRAALALGYSACPAACAATYDVDAILSLAWLAAEDENLDSRSLFSTKPRLTRR